jgi:stringent starvation protein B
MTSNHPYLLRAVHEWVCDNGLTPYIVVDATRHGVKVPPQAIREGRVVLNLAPRAVAQLEIGNDAITCTARFGGVSRSVQVPIDAVQAIYARENGQGMLLADEETAGASGGSSQSPALQVVPEANEEDAGDGEATSSPSADDNGPDQPKPGGKPNLRVIK